MYARLLATFCLLCVSIASGSDLEVGKSVVVYLKPADGLSAAALGETKSELATLLRGMGTRVTWWDAEQSRFGTDQTLIVADFTGTCALTESVYPPPDISSLPPLAHAPVVNGQVLPFAYVDCATLNQLVGPRLGRESQELREYTYGRAIGRLLAHEIHHILAQTRDHSAAGIAKQHFSAQDLLTSRFDFEPDTIARSQLAPTPRLLQIRARY
jgi:hypothetical protein